MAGPALRRMTAEEFYRWPGEEGVRYELVDGLPLKAMTGASRRHDQIVVNAISSLNGKLRGSPCRPSTDDIAIAALNGNIRRPDLSVDCGDLPDTAFEATALGAELAMAELYDGVRFPDPLAGEGPLG